MLQVDDLFVSYGQSQDIYALFPVLWDMPRRKRGNLSGGQQQQLATDPTRVPPLANAPFASTSHAGKATGATKAKIDAEGARTVPPRANTAAIATSRTSPAARRSSSRSA